MSALEWIVVIAVGVAAAPIVGIVATVMLVAVAEVLRDLLAPVGWLVDLIDPPRWVDVDEVIKRRALDTVVSSAEKIDAEVANRGERSP